MEERVGPPDGGSLTKRRPLVEVIDPGTEAPASMRATRRLLPRVCGAVAVIGGAVILLSWALHFEFLKNPFHGQPTVKPNTALSIILLGLSILLLSGAEPGSARHRVGQAIGLAVALLGFLTLCEWGFGRDVGIDQLLVREPLGTVGTSVPGRMAVATALCLVAYGPAPFLLERPRGTVPAQLAVAFGGLVALFGFLVRLYGGALGEGWFGRQTQMATPTAVFLLLVGAGLLLIHPERGLMGVLRSGGLGATAARRALPFAVGIPVVVAGLAVVGRRLDLYGPGFLAAIATALSAAFLATFTWLGARMLERVDQKRRLSETLRAEVFSRNPNPILINRFPDGKYVDVNEAFIDMFGWSREEVVGRTPVEVGIMGEEAREVVLLALRDSGEVRGLRGTRRTKSGDDIPVEFSARVIELEGEPHLIMTMQNISERRRIEQVTERSARRLEALNEISRDILVTASSGELVRVALSHVRRLIPCLRASVTRFDPEAQELVLIATATDGETTVGPGVRFPLSAVGTPEKLFRGEINRVPDVLAIEDPTPGVQRLIEEGVRSALNVPMMSEGKLIGTMNLSSDVQDGLVGEDLAAAREIADLLTVALLQSDLRDELLRHASELEEKVAERTATLAGSEARFRSLIDDAPDPILVVGQAGTIALANDRAASVFGYEGNGLIGMPLEELVSEQGGSPGASLALLVANPAARPLGTVANFRGRRKDGTVFPADISLSFTPAHAGELPLGIAFVRDVTEQVRMREELVAAKEEAERANSAKDKFLSHISHELRTPLNSVIGFAQLLEIEVTDERQAEDAGRILKGGRHLLSLIDEILEISRISAGRLGLSLEPVSLKAAINDAVDVVQSLAAERRVSIQVDDADGLHVLADRQRLAQVLLNLLSNAVKYNREGGQIRIWSEGANDRLKVSIADTGPGIPQDRQHLLFTPFERLGAEASGIEGTGLGLALTKSLIDAMGGSITAVSGPGEGTVFIVDLALAEPPIARGEQESIEEIPKAAAAAGTILYIEDNLANLSLVERILTRRSKIGLLSAMQGRLGLELARTHLPELILLDVHLPDMSGEEVLRSLRQDAATREIPVVIISADATRELEHRLLRTGANAYITKPIDLKAFLETVDSFLG